MNEKMPKSEKVVDADALRRCLKQRVAHPYITGQGLEVAEAERQEPNAPEEREAERRED